MIQKSTSTSDDLTSDMRLTLSAAQANFYRLNGFPQDGGVSRSRWSPVGCRDLKVYLPNFEWRRRALPLHDLHHVITGYEFSPHGEFQMAAWEFAAGRYPNALSTAFCLPLVAIGTAVIPGKTFAAFVRGRHSKTFYSLDKFDQTESLLNRTLGEVRREFLPSGNPTASLRDWGAFAALVSASASLIFAPIVAALAIWHFWR